MEYLLFGMYVYVALLYFIILFRVSVQFKKAYPELYKSIRCKLYTFFFFYESFIVYRVYTYIQMQMGYVIIPTKDMPNLSFFKRHEEVTFYILQLVFISFLSFVGYKNGQNES